MAEEGEEAPSLVRPSKHEVVLYDNFDYHKRALCRRDGQEDLTRRASRMGRYDLHRWIMEVHALSRRYCCATSDTVTLQSLSSAGDFDVSCTSQEGGGRGREAWRQV